MPEVPFSASCAENGRLTHEAVSLVVCWSGQNEKKFITEQKHTYSNDILQDGASKYAFQGHC